MDLANHEIFCAEVGKGGITYFKPIGSFLGDIYKQCRPRWDATESGHIKMRLSRVSSVCLQNILFKFLKDIQNIMQHPIN